MDTFPEITTKKLVLKIKWKIASKIKSEKKLRIIANTANMFSQFCQVLRMKTQKKNCRKINNYNINLQSLFRFEQKNHIAVSDVIAESNKLSI